MAKNNVLKTYSIEISAVTDKASAQIDQLEKELHSLIDNKNLSTGMQAQIDSMTKSLDGLKGELKSSTKEINKSLNKINTDKMSVQFKDMENSISKSIKEVQDKMLSLQQSIDFLSNPKNTKGLTAGFSTAFNELSNTIDNTLTKFANVSTVMQNILDGSINANSIRKDVQQVGNETKNLKKYVNELYKFMGERKLTFSDKNSLKKQSEVTLREFRVLMKSILDEANSFEDKSAIETLISKKLGVGTTDLRSFSDGISKILSSLNEKLGQAGNVEVNLVYKIADSDTKAIDSIVKEIKTKVIDKVQQKLDSTPIKIPIGYTYDTNIMKGDADALDKAAGKDVDKILLKHINLDVKANTKSIKNQIETEIDRINEQLAKSSKKIEVEVIGKVNPATIAKSSQEILEELEAEQFNNATGLNIKGGHLKIDPSSGIATENTLKDIKDIITQWNSTGIPGTQSKEFQEQVKTNKANEKYFSDFEKRIRTGRHSSVLTAQEKDRAKTKDMINASIHLDDIARQEISKLLRSSKLRQGDKSVLTESDFYSKSYTVDGVKYATFGNDGETLESWQKKWDAVFENTFATAENYNEKIGKLYNTTEKINGKTKTVEKGQLQLRREQINKRQKSQRETAKLLGLEYGKNSDGTYNHDYILGERHVITSMEDSYAKVRTVINDIKTVAQQEYDVRMQEIRGLEQQKQIMLEIHDLEVKSKNTDLLPEETDRLTYLKEQLSEEIKILSNPKKYDELINEKKELQAESRKGSLKKEKFDRLMTIDDEIDSLFVRVDNLSDHVTHQITATAEDGLSPIDKQIKYLEGQVTKFVQGVKNEIGLVYQPVIEETIEKTASDKKKEKTEKASKALIRRSEVQRYNLNVPVTSKERYDWNKKTIEKLQTENGRLGKLIQIDKNGKTRSNLMTPYEKSKYWQNTKVIEALKTQNLLYEEQQGLIDSLHTGHDYLNKSYANTASALELSGTNEEKYNQVLAKRSRENEEAKKNNRHQYTEKEFVHSLSDNELQEVNALFTDLNSNVEKQTGLTSIQIRGLVESQIQEDIDFFKAELKETEKTLLDMEKNPKKYTSRDKRIAENRAEQLQASISQLEDKESIIRNEKNLKTAQLNLKEISTQKDEIIQKLKTENGLTNDNITLLIEVLELNKQIEDEKFELIKLLNKRNEYIVKPNNANNVSEVENLNKNIRTQRSYINSLENSKGKKLSSVNYNNPWLFEQLGIVPRNDNQIPVEIEKIKNSWFEIIKNIYSKFKIDPDKIFDDDDGSYDTIFNKIKELLNIDNRNEKLLKEKQDISKKINLGIVQKMPTSYNEFFPHEATSLIELENSIDRKIIENNIYKQNLQEKLKTYLELSNEDFDSLLNQILTARKLQESEIDTESKKIKTYISNDTLTELSSIDTDYQDILLNLRAEQAKALGISQNEWMTIIKKETEKATKVGAIFNPENYVEKNAKLNLYQERVDFYTQQMTNKDNARVSTIKNYLKYTQEELTLREEIRKKTEEQIVLAKKSFDEEKKTLKNKQKDTTFTDKAYKARKKELELSYEQQIAEQETLKTKLEQERASLLTPAKRAKNGKVAKDDKSINANIERIIDNVASKEEYAYFIATKKENEIIEARNKRISNITAKQNELKAYQDDEEWARISPKLKTLQRLDNETDSEYNTRSDLNNRRQSLILSKQEAINKAEQEHQKLLKQENAELDKLNKKKEKLLSNIKTDTILPEDAIASTAESYLTYLQKERIFSDLKKESSLVGTTGTDKLYSEEEIKDLEARLQNAAQEFQDIKQQFTNDFLSYVATGTKSDTDAQWSILYQKIMNEQMMIEQSVANELIEQRDAQINEKDASINATKNKIEALEEEKKVSLQNLEVQKEIRDFEKGMNVKQKNASFAVDSKLLELQALEEELAQTQKNTKRYDELKQKIAESTLHLQWFREEAEKVGLTLSKRTGRMYLDKKNKESIITGLTYTGLARESGMGSSQNSSKSIEFSKKLQAEKLKEYQYHSKIVDEVNEQVQAEKRLTDMWRIAGMSDREAELALEIQKVNNQLKSKKKLTKEQTKALQDQLKVLHDTVEKETKAGKINLSIGKGGYVNTKVSRSDFVNNQEEYATNKIIQRMLNSSGATLSSVLNGTAPVENYRLATENTLQNIQKILMQGVNVKLLGKKYKLDYNNPRYFGKLNPKLSVDADAANPVVGDWYNKKDKKNSKKNEKEFLTRKDYNRLISKAKTEEEKNKYRTQALQSGGYFALNEKGNVVSLGTGKKRKDNKNRTDQNIIDATKKYIESQKLAVKVEDIFNESIKKSDKSVKNKTNNASKNEKDKSSSKKSKETKNQITTTTSAIEKQTEAIKENNVEREKNNATPVGTEDTKTKTSTVKSKNSKFYGEDNALKILSKEELDALSKEEFTEYIGLIKEFQQIRSKLLEDNNLLDLDNKNKYKNKDLLPQLSDIKERFDYVNEQLSSQNLPTLSPEDILGDRPKLLKEFNKLEEQTQAAIQEVTNVEEQSGQVTTKVEEQKQQNVKETRKEIDYATASFEELTKEYATANRTLANKKLGQDKKNYWTKVKGKTEKSLTEKGYSLIDGTWVDVTDTSKTTDNKSKSKANKNTQKANDIILNRDYSALGKKALLQYEKKAENAISSHLSTADAWEQALPKIKAAIEVIDDRAENYLKQFNSTKDIVKSVLDQHQDLDFGKLIDYYQHVDKQGNVFYKFKGEYGKGTIGLDDFGNWGLLDTKTYDKSLVAAKELFKELKKLDGYKFNLLESANPNMFTNSEGIKTAKENLEYLKGLLETGLDDQKLDEVRAKLNQVIETATTLKGSLKVGESEELGTIDTNNLNKIRQQMIELAKSTSIGSVEIDKFDAKNSELTYTVRTADDMLQTYSISMDKLSGKLTKTLQSETEYVSGFRKAVSALGKKFGELFRYTIASVSMYDFIRVVRQGITVVKEMDAAMTELRKVSTDTEAALQSFRKESYNIAETIGSTGKEIVNSAANWVKLGYTIQEASELAKNSALYANVGDMEIDVATEHMVSTLKAFNTEVKDSIQIVDKANQVGNKYAITSAGIGEALERSASSLVAAGNNIDQSIALITAGNIVTQDPESVGNAIKVLSLRVRGSKTELEEMGEETDNLAESTSKLRSEIQSLTGVDIMSSDNQYKSTYDILLEISKVWDTLSDVSQANVLEKLAGKTRASVVAGLLQHGDTLESVLRDSQTAAGSATEENERYMKSIQGHLDLLTNKWQEMWDTSIDSEVINFFIDLGTNILELVDKVGLVESVFGATSLALGGFLSYKKMGMFKTFNSEIDKWTSKIGILNKSFYEIEKTIDKVFEDYLFDDDLSFWESIDKNFNISKNSVSSRLINIDEVFTPLTKDSANSLLSELIEFDKSVNNGSKTWQDYFSQLDKGEEYLISFIQNTDLQKASVTDLMEAQGLAIQQAEEHNANLQQYTFSAKIASIATELFSAALNMVFTALISFAITKIIKGLDNFVHAADNARESAKDFASSINELQSTQQENTKTISELQREYKKLSEGVDNLGQNVNLTTDEYNRYHDITNQIAKIMPNLIQGYDNQGNAILNLKGHLVDLNKEYEKYKQNEAIKLYNAEDNDGNLKRQSVFEDAKNISEVGLGDYFGKYFSNFFKSRSEIFFKTLSSETLLGYLETLQSFNLDDMFDLSTSIDSSSKGFALKNILSYYGFDENTTQQEFDKIRTLIIDDIEKLKTDIDSAMLRHGQTGLLYAQSTEGFYNLNEAQQTYLSSILNNLSSDFVGSNSLNDEDTFEQFIRNLIKNLQNADVEEAMSHLYNVDTQKLALEDVNEYIDTISDSLGVDANVLRDAFGFNYDEQIQNVKAKLNKEDWNKIDDLSIDDLQFASSLEIPDNVNLSWEEFIAKIREAKKLSSYLEIPSFTKQMQGIHSLSEGLDQLDGIMADIIDGETFDYSSILDPEGSFATTFSGFTDEYNALIEAITNSPNDLSKSQKAFDDLATAYMVSKDTLSELTEETKNAAVLDLKQMGIINAEEVVDSYLELNRAKEEAISLGYNLSNITEEEALQLKNIWTASDIAKKGLFLYEIQKAQVNNNPIDTIAECNQLMNLASATRYAGSALLYLSKIQTLLNKIDNENLVEGTFAYTAVDRKLKEYNSSLQTLLKSEIKGIGVQAQFGDGAKSLAAKQQAAADATDKLTDALEKEKEALEETKSEMEELHDAVIWFYDKQIEAIDDKIEAINEENEALEKQLETMDDVLAAIEDNYDVEIEKIQEKIDALQDENDEEERALKLEEAKRKLQEAKSRKTILQYEAGKGFVYSVDTQAIKEAEEELEGLQDEEVINQLEEEINKLEEAKQKWQEIPEAYQKAMQELAAKNYFGSNWRTTTLFPSDELLQNFESDYTGTQIKIDKNEERIESLEKEKTYLEELKESWEDALNEYKYQQYEARLATFFGSDYEYQLLNNSAVWRRQFVNEYSAICAEIEALEERIKAANDSTISSTAANAEKTQQAYSETASSLEDSVTHIQQSQDEIGIELEDIAGTTKEIVDEAYLKALEINTIISILDLSIGSLKARIDTLYGTLQQMDEITLSNVIAAFGGAGGSEEGTGEGSSGKSSSKNSGEKGSSGGSGLLAAVEAVSDAIGESGEGGEGTGLLGLLDQVDAKTLENIIGQFGSEGEEGSVNASSLLNAINTVSDAIAGEGKEDSLISCINKLEDDSVEPIQNVTTEFGNLLTKIDECITQVQELATQIANLDASKLGAIGGVQIGLINIKEQEATGTAHTYASGSAYSSGTGRWGLSSDQPNSLVGEVGSEILVRDGKYSVIDSPTFMDLKKGDIIFNHKQTKAILQNGRKSVIDKLNEKGRAVYSKLTGSSFAAGTMSKNVFDALINGLSNTVGSFVSVPNYGARSAQYAPGYAGSQSMSINIGDIHVHGVDNVNGLSQEIINRLPNTLLQKLNAL